jgi:hypothetical protein
MLVSNSLAKGLAPIEFAGVSVKSTLNKGSEFTFIIYNHITEGSADDGNVNDTLNSTNRNTKTLNFRFP